MARRRVTNSEQWATPVPWTPTALQFEVAEYLAVGYSQNRAAEIVSTGKADGDQVSQQSISYWCREIPEFTSLVAELRKEWLASQRGVFGKSVALAQLVYLKAMQGERTVSEREAELAYRLLDRTLWRHAVPGGLAPGDAGGTGSAGAISEQGS